MPASKSSGGEPGTSRLDCAAWPWAHAKERNAFVAGGGVKGLEGGVFDGCCIGC